MLHALAAFFAGIAMAISGWFGQVEPVNMLALPSTSATSSASVSDASSDAADTTGSASAQSTTAATVTQSVALPTGSAWQTTLPLGDGKYVTSGAKKGYIYLCNVQTGQGSPFIGPWIHGTTWTPSEKVHVLGSVSWPNASYSMKLSGSTRTIVTNDLPVGETTGVFPIAASDPAHQYDPNPGSITAQNYTFSLPSIPAARTTPQCIYGQVGVMNDGVMLFDGFDAENRDALAHELQDSHDGHPNDGGYHYHGFTSDIKTEAVSDVVGFALDGYPITGPELPSGNYLTTNDLDECHGITSTIILDGRQVTMYHYVLTQDFPYTISCFHGTSDFKPTPSGASGSGSMAGMPMNMTQSSSASAQGSASANASAGNPPAPPTEAVTACSGKASGASCTVGAQTTGACATIGTYFACKPS